MIYSFFDENSRDVTFCCNEMSILGVNYNNNNLDNNFAEDHPIILIRRSTWHSEFKIK